MVASIIQVNRKLFSVLQLPINLKNMLLVEHTSGLIFYNFAEGDSM